MVIILASCHRRPVPIAGLEIGYSASFHDSMLALNHKLVDIKDFPRFRFPWEGYLKDTFTNPVACRFPVLDTIV